MMKGKKEVDLALPGATQQANSCESTGDSAGYKRSANQVLHSHKRRDQQRNQEIKERQIYRT
ncbi:hypothetical protein DPMN_092667 [Dreissena polymorpha]|uniref:Uncharacterized protein n=1 Tax=Dreissena polymorpha TaxID=45954 RepID=A0A9D4R0E2_DREPO|nr:hypothetical protein DPMN_092667 [Dreissena polymorpha]